MVTICISTKPIMSFVQISASHLPRHLLTSGLFQAQHQDEDEPDTHMFVPENMVPPIDLHSWLDTDTLSPEQIAAFTAMTIPEKTVYLNRMFTILQYWMVGSLPPVLQDAAYTKLVTTVVLYAVLRKNKSLRVVDVFDEMLLISVHPGLGKNGEYCFTDSVAGRRAAVYVMSRGFIPGDVDAITAARVGSVYALRLFARCTNSRAINVLHRRSKLFSIVRRGQLKVLQYLRDEHYVLFPKELLEQACHCGQLDILRYIHSYALRCEFTYEATVAAAKKGHLNCLQYLIERKCIGTRYLPTEQDTVPGFVYVLLENGHLDCVKQLETQTLSPDTKALWMNPYNYCAAVRSGKIECIEYLQQIKCPFHPKAHEVAADIYSLILGKFNYWTAVTETNTIEFPK
jgi:hypothetical protein